VKEMFRNTLFLGFILISSVARAVTPDAIEPTQELTKKLSVVSPVLRGFQFERSGPKPPNLASTGSSRQPIEVFGEIVQLPMFVVEARRNVPEEKEMLTDFGRLQFAKNKFTTPLYRATFGPLAQVAAYYFNFLTILNGWHPSDAEAMALYRESERAQILTDFDDLCRLEDLRDPHAGEELRQMRSRIWRTGIDSLYWDPFAGPSGIHIGGRKR
jgi:hypothetical protein